LRSIQKIGPRCKGTNNTQPLLEKTSPPSSPSSSNMNGCNKTSGSAGHFLLSFLSSIHSTKRPLKKVENQTKSTHKTERYRPYEMIYRSIRESTTSEHLPPAHFRRGRPKSASRPVTSASGLQLLGAAGGRRRSTGGSSITTRHIVIAT
jgi:hypothetical protein